VSYRGRYGMPYRSRACRGTLSMALRIGSLPAFSSPWSRDHGAVVSTGFPSSDAGWGPHRSRRTVTQATPHLLNRIRVTGTVADRKGDSPLPIPAWPHPHSFRKSQLE